MINDSEGPPDANARQLRRQTAGGRGRHGTRNIPKTAVPRPPSAARAPIGPIPAAGALTMGLIGNRLLRPARRSDLGPGR